MGQYWLPVNLDKREFIQPHRLGAGLKLWEQVASGMTGKALLVLTAAMPERRGGGDLEPDPIIGRWAGDRIVIVGDYAEPGDFPTKEGDPSPAEVYGLCPYTGDKEPREGAFTDVSDEVCAVLERELEIKFVGDGWRSIEKAA